MNLPYPFNKASGVRADTEGTINLIDARGKPLALIPLPTAFELSPEIKGRGDGTGYSSGYGFSYGHGEGSGYGSGFGYGQSDGSGFGSGNGSGKSK